MGKGRVPGTKNKFFYKYQLIHNNGDVKLYNSQNQIGEEYPEISRTKLNKIVNHPILVSDAPFQVIKIKDPLPVFERYYDTDEEKIKYRYIIYDFNK
tara:strand:- start:117 stop:407 length:291 start_codon:yes stop_codon:yes gene_type:complete